MAITPEQREFALNLLRQKGHLALTEVERLIAWQGRPGWMTYSEMARALGTNEGELFRLVRLAYLREKDRRRRSAQRSARAVELTEHTSHNLRFSVSLPVNWRVVMDTCELVPAAQEHLELLLRSGREKRPTRFHWRAAWGRPKIPSEFQERWMARQEFEERKAAAERHARLERMAVGLFQAVPAKDDDEAFIEFTRFRLESRLTAMELYNLDKHLPEAVTWGNRPSKPMVVDGLHGVVYYFVMHTGAAGPLSESYAKEPAFFNVYLAEDLEGWIISCQCRCGEAYMKTFHRYKPIFRRIIGTFRRTQVR